MSQSSVTESMPKLLFPSKLVAKKYNLIVEIISALFILLFLYTAISKSFKIVTTVEVLKQTPHFSSFAVEIAWTVVVLEYFISFLLFFPRTRMKGLIASVAMMSAFSLYIGYMKIFAPRLPCSCGGVISKMGWNEHLIFNLIFILLGAIAIFSQSKISIGSTRIPNNT